MGLEHFHDLVADPHQRIERRHRLLEHHGDAPPAHLAPAIVVKFDQIPALEQDLTGLGGDAGGQQPHERMGAHRLAGAGFADHADDFAGIEIERDAAQGIGTLAAFGQGDFQVFDGDGGGCGHVSGRPWRGAD